MPYLNLKSKERDNKKGVRYNGYKAYFWITSFLILSSHQSPAHLLPVLAVREISSVETMETPVFQSSKMHRR